MASRIRHRITPPLAYEADHTPYGPRQVSHGGPPFSGRYRRTNHSANVYEIKAPNAHFWKTRGPFFTIGNSFPIADVIRQSELPTRPNMHMATGSYRSWTGNTKSRWRGYHTYLSEEQAEAKAQGLQKGGMRTARRNRLTVQQYRGQTYSQSTNVLGGG